MKIGDKLVYTGYDDEIDPGSIWEILKIEDLIVGEYIFTRVTLKPLVFKKIKLRCMNKHNVLEEYIPLHTSYIPLMETE